MFRPPGDDPLLPLVPSFGSLAGGRARTPGAYFSRAGKVGKRALRGSTPKNPGFWRSGRGEVSLTSRIDSRQELPTQALPGSTPDGHVGASCASVVSACWRKRPRSTAPPLPTGPAALGSGGDPRRLRQESGCFSFPLAVHGAAEFLNRQPPQQARYRGETVRLSAQAGPSEAEGPDRGAGSNRYPRAGKRSKYLIVHQRGT